MPEIDLTLYANNQQFIKSITDANAAQQNFFDSWGSNIDETSQEFTDMVKGAQAELKRLGLSEDEFLAKYKQAASGQKGLLEGLNDDLKTYRQLKEKAMSTDEINKFNKKISETEKEIKKLQGTTEGSGAKFDKLKGILTKAAVAVGVVVAAFQVFKKIMASTGETTDKFDRAMFQAKTATDFFMKSLVSGDLDNFWGRLKEVNKAAGEYFDVLNRLQNENRSLSLQEKEKNISIQANLTIARDQTRSDERRIVALKKIVKDETELAKTREKNSYAEYSATIQLMAAQTGLSVKQLESFVKEYGSLSNIIELAEQYNDLIKQRANSFEIVATSQYTSMTVETELTKKLDKDIAKLGEGGKNASVLLKKYGKSTKEEYDKLADVAGKYFDAVASKDQNLRRVQGELSGFIQGLAEKETAKRKEEKEKQKKLEEEFNNYILELTKRYQAAQLELLTGKERIDAESKFAQKELALFLDNLKQKGKLSKEQEAQIVFISESIIKKGLQEKKKLATQEKLDLAKSKAGLIETILKNSEDEIDLTSQTELEKLDLKVDAYNRAIQLLTEMGDNESLLMAENLKKVVTKMHSEAGKIVKEQKFSFWELLGIDENTDEGKEQMEGVKAFTSTMLDSIGQIMDAETQLAEARTQRAEDRISELESQLSEEQDLQEQGLANNVSLIKQELAQAKIERDKALEEERKAKQAQFILDTVGQVSSLITASANIFKATSFIPPPFGQLLAIGAIATMFGAFATAKIKANQAAKMEQGGYIDEYGVVHGKRHSEGGEVLMKHVEVEQGEGVGVFNRSATSYYGGQLPKWVSSINHKNFPKFDIRPELKANQVFDLKTGMMNSELKAIKNGIDNLNQNLINQQSTTHNGNVRIEVKGNRKRIIHVKD